MEENYLCYNNKFYSENQPIFGLNRALKYGDGLFESIRIINGKACFLRHHFSRLIEGLKVLQIEFSLAQKKEIELCINQLLIKNEIENDGALRLSVFRNGKGKYKPESNKAEYFIETELLKTNSFMLNKKGLSIGICNKIKLSVDQFSAIKSMNSLPYIQASLELMKSGLDDLIITNKDNRLVEATSSNLFLVIGNKLYTPHLTEGCLNGVMRKIIIQKAIDLGVYVQEMELNITDLEKSDEVFLTNSIRGIQWVSSFKTKRYFNKISRMLFESILTK